MPRLDDLSRFYDIMQRLERQIGGFRRLADCHGRQDWPRRGVYFFFENGEGRSTSGVGPRVVRVGTHALTEKSGSSLWGRLSQHRGGAKVPGGNHRGSIFRSLIGEALQQKGLIATVPSWGVQAELGKAASVFGMKLEELRAEERGAELAVSAYLGEMQILWVDIPDPAGTASLRGVVERNSIGLLSNLSAEQLDAASPSWLGASSGRELVRRSGLWNNRHVDEGYDAAFLDQIAALT